MIERLLPDFVTVVEHPPTDPLEPLLEGEEGAILMGSAARRLEYVAGRQCARAALRNLGVVDTPIPVGSGGQPIWPPGIVGSITHCYEYCAAAAAKEDVVRSIGIDAEIQGRVSERAFNRITSANERQLLPASAIEWKTLVFSAKEAIYKAWFQLTGTWLAHRDVEVRIDPAGTFRVVQTGESFGVHQSVVDSLQGRWNFRGRYVFATALVTNQNVDVFRYRGRSV